MSLFYIGPTDETAETVLESKCKVPGGIKNRRLKRFDGEIDGGAGWGAHTKTLGPTTKNAKTENVQPNITIMTSCRFEERNVWFFSFSKTSIRRILAIRIETEPVFSDRINKL